MHETPVVEDKDGLVTLETGKAGVKPVTAVAEKGVMHMEEIGTGMVKAGSEKVETGLICQVLD